MLNLSTNPATYVSVMDISEVNPAKTNEVKNKKPKRPLSAGNSLIICENTTNANPTHQVNTSSTGIPACVDINPKTENTPIPANSSKLEFPNPVINALFVISDFFGK